MAIIAGISQTSDLGALRKAIAGAGLPADALQWVEPEGGALSRGRLAGGDIMTSDGGTRVPGISDSRTGAPSQTLSDRVGELEIPDGELDNFVEAVENGRTAVTYFAQGDGAAQVEQMFRDAGLSNVRRYD